MAAAVQPSGLMDIASTLTQDEIPFKLRCAICNKLAVNAFKLPCCDQAICENCQTSLPDTCPVCAHTPLSSDLCKPNKALRTTLKAFLRTEEKKREKERQAALPATPDAAAPSEESPAKQDTQQDSNGVEETPADGIIPEVTEVSPAEKALDTAPSAADDTLAPAGDREETNGVTQNGLPVGSDTADPTTNVETSEPVEGDTTGDNEPGQPPEQDASQNAMPAAGFPNPMGFNMNPGMFPNMAWGANPMAQFMGNGMMGFPNPMAMTGMGMDPMAVNQGMFGGYGMNMNGMNMGMNLNGQGMFGGWDGSQNSMWNGSQDKFNPNAFANGMGAQLGDPSGYGGYNMSQDPQMQQQQYPSQDFSNGPYGTGNFRGRGRGYYSSRGRGGFSGHMQFNHPHSANYTAQDGVSNMDQTESSLAEEGTTAADGELPTGGKNADTEASATEATEGANNPEDRPNGNLDSVPEANGPTDQTVDQEYQLQGIPTIESLDQSASMIDMGGPVSMSQGFGRGSGYMRGGFHGRGASFGGQQFMPPNSMQPRGPVVEGAPAAPRAMRQGLPNTSVYRQRNFQAGRGPVPTARGIEASETPHPDANQEDQHLQATSRSISRARSRSKSRTRSPSPPFRSRSNSRRRYPQRSRSLEKNGEDYDRQRDRYRKSYYEEKDKLATGDGRRTRSPSVESYRSSRNRDEGRSRRARRSHRSRRHRSRSRSASGNRRSDRDDERLAAIAEERSTSNSRGKDNGTRSSRREEDRERDRDARRRDRDRERDRDRDRRRERERERDRERDRPRERERDRKRSRRDRSESAVDSDHYSRRTKRGREDEARSSKDRAKDTKETPLPTTKTSELEKDPHTLEREARNRERLLKEQQRREAMNADRDSGKSSRRRDSRQERTGRRLNYKYDDESDSARAARVEREREASRWD